MITTVPFSFKTLPGTLGTRNSYREIRKDCFGVGAVGGPCRKTLTPSTRSRSRKDPRFRREGCGRGQRAFSQPPGVRGAGARGGQAGGTGKRISSSASRAEKEADPRPRAAGAGSLQRPRAPQGGAAAERLENRGRAWEAARRWRVSGGPQARARLQTHGLRPSQ